MPTDKKSAPESDQATDALNQQSKTPSPKDSSTAKAAAKSKADEIREKNEKAAEAAKTSTQKKIEEEAKAVAEEKAAKAKEKATARKVEEVVICTTKPVNGKPIASLITLPRHVAETLISAGSAVLDPDATNALKSRSGS